MAPTCSAIATVALDARSGALKWWYQLRPNDDHDWDATVVMLFDSDGKKLLATSGKQGILHVVDRDDGKLVFKLPVTTVLNRGVPLTAEGVRVCPGAGVQWNGPAYSPSTKLLYVNAIDWCTVFKLRPDPKWVATVPYTELANGLGHQQLDRQVVGVGQCNRPRHRRGRVARQTPHPNVRCGNAHCRRGPVYRRS